LSKLFNLQTQEAIEAQAAKSQQLLEPVKAINTKSIKSDLQQMSSRVVEAFKESVALLLTTEDELSAYIDEIIDVGYAGIDTETTGLDRRRDTVVGVSLYYPGGIECYIPCKHLIPIFNELRSNQLPYDVVGKQLQRLVDAGTKLIFANADFDLSMIYKDLKVDLTSIFYYDVILAWRCLKEDEKRNGLKELYNKYVLKGEGDENRFTDFFTPSLFPYCEPEVAKLYAAHDAKITYELFVWQIPYITPSDPKCIKNNLQQISNLIWNIEFPLVTICQKLHRTGVYLEKSVADQISRRYSPIQAEELAALHEMVEAISENPKYMTKTRKPWGKTTDFNPDSSKHVSYLIYDMLKLDTGSKNKSTDKAVLGALNLPITNKILQIRSLRTVISTFVEKLPKAVWSDNRIHCTFKQVGADTGRMSSADPNMQNIPSRRKDIRLMFRASPGHVQLSCDYSAQEPRLTAYCSGDEKMIQAFKDGKDIYGTLGSMAFNVPYEQCIETWPDGTYNPEGKKRRDSIKTVLLGVTYGRSVETVAEQLYGSDKSLDRDAILKKGQAVIDAVMMACPALRSFMINAQNHARKYGFVQTITGRRRHIPDMQLPPFEFRAKTGYINPDVDPMDIDTLDNATEIPQRIVDALKAEFAGLKYFGQKMKRIRELDDTDKIRVINNERKISDATRQCVNSIIQGSAADMTKMALLEIDKCQEWHDIGAQLLIPVHDEIIAEVPIEHAERGAQLISELMCKAADFLPFPMKCDVTTTYRWYGLDFFNDYIKPQSLHDISEGEIKWLKYCLFEVGYKLTPIKVEGQELGGDGALGINGIMNEECRSYIADYMSRNRIDADTFIDHIWNRVHLGVLR